jgi:hypothetical protein
MAYNSELFKVSLTHELFSSHSRLYTAFHQHGGKSYNA